MMNVVTKTIIVTTVMTVTNFRVIGNVHTHIVDCGSECYGPVLQNAAFQHCLFILQVMKTHGCYQLVFSSSCTVYGNPEVLPITEEHHTGNVTNVYGRTKYFIEEMLKDISAAEKVKLKLICSTTGLFISPSGTSELDCATTKTDTAERSISIGRESLKVFFILGALAYLQVPPLGGSHDEKWRAQ